MEAKDLRIGNTVTVTKVYAYFDMHGSGSTSTKEEIKITSLNDKGIELQFFNGHYVQELRPIYPFSRVEGIPLTEEWLIKLLPNYKEFGIKSNGDHVYFVHRESELYIDIKSVHQLQNLYFDLTEKEL